MQWYYQWDNLGEGAPFCQDGGVFGTWKNGLPGAVDVRGDTPSASDMESYLEVPRCLHQPDAWPGETQNPKYHSKYFAYVANNLCPYLIQDNTLTWISLLTCLLASSCQSYHIFFTYFRKNFWGFFTNAIHRSDFIIGYRNLDISILYLCDSWYSWICHWPFD